MVKTTFHGNIGEFIGGSEWNLSVKSPQEALRAIESQTKKLRKYLLKKQKEGIGYKILINKENYQHKSFINKKKHETIRNSKLCIIKKNLKTIYIIPIIEG